MAEPAEDRPIERGAEYEFDTGVLEVVFETAEGRVLTVREYPSRGAFEESASSATYRGTNEAVRSLPDVGAFEDW